MSDAAKDPVPVLAPPGAGLPKGELLIARVLVKWRCWTTSRSAATATIAAERQRIGGIARQYGSPEGMRRILIPRLRGLEDSSRYWSVFMTVAHLKIVNRGIVGTIGCLLEDRVPARVASTAAVKPLPESGPDEIVAFEASCESLLALGRVERSLKTGLGTPIRGSGPWMRRIGLPWPGFTWRSTATNWS